MRIAIVGAGWNGCHLATELANLGHSVTILEKHPAIFQGCSGQFGIRLHRGPHYPRSKSTRESCHSSFNRFCETYPELVKSHEESIYALGKRDAENHLPKVSEKTFEAVCLETKECRRIDVEAKAIRGVSSAYDLSEPSIAVGRELQSSFERRLAATSVEVILNAEVERTRRRPYGPLMVFYTAKGKDGCARRQFLDTDLIINATGYQSLTPALGVKPHPLGLDVVYQVCLAFRYEDTSPGEKPISFIVMDGWFPCLMPSIDQGPSDYPLLCSGSGRYNTDEPNGGNPVKKPSREYILTHGSYTILGSFPQPEQAQSLLDRISEDSPVTLQIRTAAEDEMTRFWPSFKGRFVYRGWQGTVQAKLRTHCEFRSSVVFEKDRVIYVFPGKISNVFNACDEVLELIAARTMGDDGISRVEEDVDGYRFVGGVPLDEARRALGGVAGAGVGGKKEAGNTCDLQTYTRFLNGKTRTEDHDFQKEDNACGTCK